VALENQQHRLPPEASVEASSPRARGLVARLLRSERGQGVVEFAMILPLLGALIFALIDFGKALYYYIDLTHVANEGARIAAVSQATMPNGATSLKGYLCTQFGSGSELNTGSASVNKAVVAVSYDNNNSKNVGDPVTVSVSTTYHWIPFWNIGTMNISSSATMRIENPPSATGTTVITGGTCP
jgi:Flp pilus assembly protein TadG